MENNKPGIFSLSLRSLSLSLATLMSESGGVEAVTLLDRLAELPKSKRELLVHSFSKITDQIISQSAEEDSISDFEEALLAGILKDFEQLESAQEKSNDHSEKLFSLADLKKSAS